MNRGYIAVASLGAIVALHAGCGTSSSVEKPAHAGGSGASGGGTGGGWPSGGSGGSSGGSHGGVAGSSQGGAAGSSGSGAAGTSAGGDSGQSGSGGCSSGAAGSVQCGTGGPCEFPQGVPEADFIASACTYQETDPAVDDAVNTVMASLSGCSISSDCTITGFPGTTVDEICQSWFAAVTAQLRAQGFCAGQHIVGSTDEIAVSNTCCEGKWYGYHICNYGGAKVVWNPGARRGWWMINPTYCGT